MASASSPSPEPLPPPQPNWLNLPTELMAMILHRLGPIEILESAQKVCMTWRVICKEPSMWKSIDMHNLGDHNMPYDLEKMCQHAVDRSSGRLEHINIEYFGTEALIRYISDRAPLLKSLRLACHYGTFQEGLNDVAEKWPNLEEFHLFFTTLPTKAFESFGRSCPRLKSLTYNIQGSRLTDIEEDSDEEAIAISQTMPGLRHLSLFGNQMTNNGLQAILDGCPHLESLDIRQCFNVDLSGDMGKMCARRIKNLKKPNDSTVGYEFDATVYDEWGYSSNEDEYPSGFSDVDFYIDADYDYEFSGDDGDDDDDDSFMSDIYGGLFLD